MSNQVLTKKSFEAQRESQQRMLEEMQAVATERQVEAAVTEAAPQAPEQQPMTQSIVKPATQPSSAQVKQPTVPRPASSQAPPVDQSEVTALETALSQARKTASMPALASLEAQMSKEGTGAEQSG